MLTRHSQAPTAHAGSATKPNPAMLRAVCLVQLVLLCCTSEDPAQLKRDMRSLLCPSLPLPALPFLSLMSTSLQKLGKTSDVCRLVCFLLLECPCVSCQMDRKGLLPLPMVCCSLLPSSQPSTRHPLLSLPSSSHCIYLKHNQLLFLQPLEIRVQGFLGLPI